MISKPGVTASTITGTLTSVIPTGICPDTSTPTITFASRFISKVAGTIDWKPPTQPNGRLPILHVVDKGTFPEFFIHNSPVPICPKGSWIIPFSDVSKVAIS